MELFGTGLDVYVHVQDVDKGCQFRLVLIARCALEFCLRQRCWATGVGTLPAQRGKFSKEQ